MSWLGDWWGAAATWIAAALVLALAELALPGFFLVFIAIGAGATGLVLVLFPAPILLQAVLFAAFIAGAVALGRRYYRRRTASADPLINERSARLIGRVVTVSEAMRNGEGRVTIGDGAWTARGPDAPAGTSVRVIAVSGSAVEVEPA